MADRLTVFLQVVTIVAVVGTWFIGSYELLKWERDAAHQRETNHENIVIMLSEIANIKKRQSIVEDFLKRRYPLSFPHIP